MEREEASELLSKRKYTPKPYNLKLGDGVLHLRRVGLGGGDVVDKQVDNRRHGPEGVELEVFEPLSTLLLPKPWASSLTTRPKSPTPNLKP